ncbi:MAG TPA: tyrosine-type recombinase/integrase [Bryobacteraceae bacterium]|jgi:integrase|nr:tyrosine-type recombinase/integrase [Bryobacteraceae bacterium]
MSKSDAREEVGRIVKELMARHLEGKVWRFGEFVGEVYFPYYKRKWKNSTRDNNVSRVQFHLVSKYDERELASLKRDELQDLLDAKAAAGLSFSVVDHLRWDLKQVFDMAVAEGHIERNPALLLFTPRDAAKPKRRVMNFKEVQICFGALELRERLIAKLALVAGMRLGEVFALTWGRLTAPYVEIRRRVYRGTIDTPKTDNSYRRAALSEGLLSEIEAWRGMAVSTREDAWVFPSERMTPLSKDNCWRRNMLPALERVGHTLDVNQNVYTQSPVELRQAALNQLERRLQVM